MDLKVKIGKSFLPNPVGVASGTFGYGDEYNELIDIKKIGAIYTKAITLKPKKGNNEPRLIETPAGMLNAIGLANVGVDTFLEIKMKFLSALPCAVIPNIAGSSEDEYITVLEKLESNTSIWGYEINLSCPNVKQGCLAFGTEPEYIESIVGKLRLKTYKPLIIKLTPNVTDIAILAKSAQNGGADAISCINTITGMAINTVKKIPALSNITGGLSGPAIRPVGVAMVYKVSQAVNIPIIGIGGIMTADDALQYLMAGASAVQVGTGNFIDPLIPEKVLRGIKEFFKNEKLTNISDIHKYKENWQ